MNIIEEVIFDRQVLDHFRVRPGPRQHAVDIDGRTINVEIILAEDIVFDQDILRIVLNEELRIMLEDQSLKRDVARVGKNIEILARDCFVITRRLLVVGIELAV